MDKNMGHKRHPDVLHNPETVAELIKNKEEEFNFFVSIFWDTGSIINCWKPHEVADIKENVRAVLEKIDGILFHIKDENNL